MTRKRDWHSHDQLMYWIWACLESARAYLLMSKEYHEILFERKNPVSMELRTDYRYKVDLAKYNFIMTLGSLCRNLKVAQHLFPEIQPAYSRAHHLIKEGNELRGMVEHSDEYFSGRGKHKERWIRSDSPFVGSSADPTSTIVNEEGHWLGGRLNVEKIILEVCFIQDAAKNIKY